MWPGLVVAAGAAGAAEVVLAEGDAGVPTGAALLSCDGHGLDELMAERVLPCFWNAAIPHERSAQLHRLLFQDALDPAPRLKTCRFSSGEVTLKWRRETDDSFRATLDRALRKRTPTLAMRQADGLWMISVPTWAYSDENAVRRIRGLLADISARVALEAGRPLARVDDPPRAPRTPAPGEPDLGPGLPAHGRGMRERLSGLRGPGATTAGGDPRRAADVRGCDLHRQYLSGAAQPPGGRRLFDEGLSKSRPQEQRMV